MNSWTKSYNTFNEGMNYFHIVMPLLKNNTNKVIPYVCNNKPTYMVFILHFYMSVESRLMNMSFIGEWNINASFSKGKN